jgi:hypothetical protein
MIGGGPTQMTEKLRRVSLTSINPQIKKWLTTLKAQYRQSNSTNLRGQRSHPNKLPTALQAPRIIIHKAGSRRAVDIVTRARWAHIPSATTGDHVNLGLLQLLDVIVVSDCVPPLSSVENGPRYLTLEGGFLCHESLCKEGGWSLIRRPSLVVRGNDVPEILSLYITAECDPRIANVLNDAEAVQNGMRKYLSQVKFNKQSNILSNAARRLMKKKRGHEGQSSGRPHYALGLIEMDGLFQFRFASGYGYYTRDLMANTDMNYLKRQARLYCGMFFMETQHTPVLANQRIIVSNKVPGFQGIFPGLGRHMCPASSVGASMGYACDGHNDSSIPGVTETIFWTAPKKGVESLLPDGEKWTFANAEAGLLFDLQDAAKKGGCCLYIPGSVMHNSMPTGCNNHTVHRGMGFVMVNKGTVLSSGTQRWFEGNPNSLVFAPANRNQKQINCTGLSP